jgi:hypothetical protein
VERSSGSSESGEARDDAPPSSGRDPDLRHVRYVALSPAPPGRRPSDIPLKTRVLRAAVLGAFAGGTMTVQVMGSTLAGLALGGAAGAAAVLLGHWRRTVDGRPFALVPWGILIDGERDLMAVRWSGVRALDVRYRAAFDGSVHARVAVDSVAGPLVGFSSDAVDLGALAGDLAGVTQASARPIAVDHESRLVAEDGEPFVDRVLHAARTFLAAEGHALGIEPASYRDVRGSRRAGGDVVQERVARSLRAIGERATGDADAWGFVAALAGELRLRSFARTLARLANAPNPGVAAIARAALGRIHAAMRDATEAPDTDTPANDLDCEEGEALSWFVSPDELERLRVWRDAE